MRRQKNRAKRKKLLCAILAAVWMLSTAGTEANTVKAALAAKFVQMPGYVVEQWSMSRPMLVHKAEKVTVQPNLQSTQIGEVLPGQYLRAWGQTDTGWYFIECQGTIAYVRYEAAAFVTEEQFEKGHGIAQAQEQAAAQQAQIAAQQAQAAAQEAARQAQAAAQQAAAEAARQAQIAAAAAQQPIVTAGVVFIGDSRMVTLKEAVEKALGACPAAVVAENGSRQEWFHDHGIPQADKIIGKGSKVVINMGVNDLNHADKYAQDVNFWAAVWSARGAQVYYASVNPVWANSYGLTKEKVDAFNAKLRPQLIPQVIWLDSNTYLMQTGVHAYDGLHYKDDTNLVLFNYYMTMIGAV